MTPTNDNEDDTEPLPQADVHRTTVRDETSVTLTIVRELSDLCECGPTDLEPIYYDVDPDKLDWIVGESDENKVSFHTNGYAVTAYGDGTLVFSPTGE